MSFKARPIAVYKPFCDTVKKELCVYELEPRDIGFLKKYKKKMLNDDFLKAEFPVHHDIIVSSLDSIIGSLKIRDKFKIDDKSAAFISVCKGKITAITKGNTPKIDLKNDKIVYSNRNVRNESELDWLVCVPESAGKIAPKASAPAVITEVFNYCLGLKPMIKSLYCRSEIPERCMKSLQFYKKLGFKELGAAIPLQSPQRPLDLPYFLEIDQYEHLSDPVIPLKITRRAMEKSVNQISEKFEREPVLNSNSIDLGKVVF